MVYSPLAAQTARSLKVVSILLYGEGNCTTALAVCAAQGIRVERE